jgi:hypothetical protein
MQKRILKVLKNVVVYVFFLGKGRKLVFVFSIIIFILNNISDRKMSKKVLLIAKHLKVMKMEK